MKYYELTHLSVIVRIVMALVIGGVIGVERGMKNRPAGLRTYMLVCVGSCLVMMTNQYIYETTGTGDPVRLGAQVVSGIGFLGAGTIIVTKRNHIKGLTTAAGLWAAAGVGLALGTGFYEGALIAGGLIFLIMTLLHRMEVRMYRSTKVLEVYVELSEKTALGTFIHGVRALDLEISDLQFESDAAQIQGAWGILATLRANRRRDHLLLLEEVRKIEGVVHLEEL